MGFFRDTLRRAQGLPTESDISLALNALREQIALLNALALTLDASNPSSDDDMSLFLALRIDLMNFALHIASSDGVLEPNEVEAINSFLGMDLSYNDAKFAIEELGLGGHAFVRELPASFQILTEIARGSDADAKEFTMSLINTYRNLGSVIAMVDGDVDPREKQDLDRYINMLERYASTF